MTVGPGVTYLKFSHPGFAESHVGPFGAGAEKAVSGVRVVLRRGIDVPVTIVDENGAPVADARIGAVSMIGGVGTTRRKAPTTDENGQAVLRHVNPELEYSLTVTARGFQKISRPNRKLAANAPVRFEMLHARPATGTVVDRRGEGVANATVKPHRSRRQGITHSGGLWDQKPAVSDAEGRFRLTELEDNTTYDLLVKADGYAPTAVADVHP